MVQIQARVCDPDGLLDAGEVAQVNEALAEMEQGTVGPGRVGEYLDGGFRVRKVGISHQVEFLSPKRDLKGKGDFKKNLDDSRISRVR